MNPAPFSDFPLESTLLSSEQIIPSSLVNFVPVAERRLQDRVSMIQ